jgi:hypothetical protein
MLNIDEAIKIINKNLPDEKINSYIEYKNLYLFQVFSKRELEEDLDPFYSVNRETGEFRDFSVLTDGDISEISALFLQVRR